MLPVFSWHVFPITTLLKVNSPRLQKQSLGVLLERQMNKETMTEEVS